MSVLRRGRGVAALLAMFPLAWTTACSTTQPYRASAAGAAPANGGRAERVSVELSPAAAVHFRSAAGDTISVAPVEHLTGTVVEMRGDTVVLGDPRVAGMPVHFTPPGRATTVAAAALLPPESHALLTVRRLNGTRTALLGLGALFALATVVAAAWPAGGYGVAPASALGGDG